MANPPGYVPEFGQGLRANPHQQGTEGGKEWLKRQKLHKYWPMFSHWSYSDFMSISDENISEKIQEIGATGMTNGARGKLVRCIKMLRDREDVLLAIQRAIRAEELFVADALLYLMEVVRTPLPTDPAYTICATIIITLAEVKSYIARRKCIKYVHIKMSNLEEMIERRPGLKAAMTLSIDIMKQDRHRQEDLSGSKELFRRRILTEDSGYEEMITNPTETPVGNNSKWIVHPSGRQSGALSPRYKGNKYSHNFGSNNSYFRKEEIDISKPFQYDLFPNVKKPSNPYQNPVYRYEVKSNKAKIEDDKTYSSVLRSNIIGIKTDTEPDIYANSTGAIPKKNYQEKSFNKTDKNEGYKLSFPNPSTININEKKNVSTLYKELRKCIDPPNVPVYPRGLMTHCEVPSRERPYRHPMPNIQNSYSALNSNPLTALPYIPHPNETDGIDRGYYYDLPLRKYLFPNFQLIPPTQSLRQPLEFTQHVVTNTTEGNLRNLVKCDDNTLKSRSHFIDHNTPETKDLLNTTSMLVTEILEKVLDKDYY